MTHSRKLNVARGDGSPEKPILVVNVGDLYATLGKRFPGYQLIQQRQGFDEHGRRVDLMAIRTAQGSSEVIHFRYIE